ncbi:TPA: hypothetical protein ACGU4A_004869, partial [Vibrio vulnificus]
FNHVNQLVASFLCSLGLLILCSSAKWLHLALFSGHLFFGAGNSKRCLNQFSGKCEVRAVGSIRNLTFRFGLEQSKFEVVCQIYESFLSFRSWLLFENQSRVNLGFDIT